MSELTLSFPSFMRPEFDQKLVNLNKKLAKMKDANTVTIRKEEHRQGKLYLLQEKKYISVLKTDITLTLPVVNKIPGKELVGTIDISEDCKSYYSNEAILSTLAVDNRCDHCKTNRKRKRVFALRDKNTQAIEIIGSTCIDIYLGLSVESALRTFYKFVDVTKDESTWQGPMRDAYKFTMEAMINATTLAFIDNPTYVKKGFGTTTTAEAANCYHYKLTDNFCTSAEERASTKEMADNHTHPDDMKKLLLNYYANLDTTSSNFNANIKEALFYSKTNMLRDFVPAKARGIVIWAIFNVLKKESMKTTTTTHKPGTVKANDFLGKIGSNTTINGEVIKLLTVNNMYGQNRLVVLESPEGNQAKFFTNAKFAWDLTTGDKVKVDGIVKKHEVFKNAKSTLLRMPKLVK